MPKNSGLSNANKNKQDEFYTQYTDIQKEVNAYLEYNPDVFRGKTILLPCDDPEWSNFTKFFAQNFERFGLKKLISTSYAMDKKKEKYEQYGVIYQLSLFETESPKFDEQKSKKNGKVFILDKDDDKSGRIDINDLKWDYLEGDGDFRSDEVKKLRDESDIIITNPPFSLFREFVNWVNEGNKEFLIIGNINSVTYKEIFPLIKENKMWLGESIHSGDREFRVPNTYPLTASGTRIDEHGNKYIRVKGVRWFTNLDHGRRHQPLDLMSYDENIKYSKHKDLKEIGYKKYDNYDALDVPYSDSIPKNYKKVMGVPITFVDKYSPEQFSILGMAAGNTKATGFNYNVKYNPHPNDRGGCGVIEGQRVYARFLIQYTNEWIKSHINDFNEDR